MSGRTDLALPRGYRRAWRPIRYLAPTACRRCQLKAQGTRPKAGRRMTRWVHKDVLERRQERVKADPVLQQQRQHRIAHPFGPIKPGNDQGYLLHAP
jgi:hypothetical protein